MDAWLKVDFHCHSSSSPDSISRPVELVRRARRAGLDRLVITDHNLVRGAWEAQKIDPDLIIVGEEIETGGGEILAAYVQEQIPEGLPLCRVIELLRQQGAFISVSHPFDPRRSAWSQDELQVLAESVDAVEVFNARCFRPQFNQAAQEFARQHGLGGTVGTDAHAPGEVGRSFLRVPAFSSGDELRRVIHRGVIEGQHTSPFAIFASRLALIGKR